jgi:uncharacterized protein YeaO (DUF488 family)
MDIRLKRAYDPPSPDDGTRVLVERLWPRGLSKERAAVDLWPREVAPSPDLRSWYEHDPAKWPEFQRRYREELRTKDAELEQLRDLAATGTVTFVFGSRETVRNSANVLREVLEED